MLSVIQLEQDFAICSEKFPNLICNAVAVQFMKDNLVALFIFEMGDTGIRLLGEKHYRLTPSSEISRDELLSYRSRLPEHVLI
ncbi:MAG: hypothetical protein P4L55_07460 [Syntrophobacteraceae bacterium]|nr:hypothetical protein [Syntrophobacteraceae bacterium]